MRNLLLSTAGQESTQIFKRSNPSSTQGEKEWIHVATPARMPSCRRETFYNSAAISDVGNSELREHSKLVLRLKCDGARAETRFRLSAKRTSPFKPAGASVQSTTGSRGVRISGSNVGYTMFRGSVMRYCLPIPFASFPFTSPPERHRVPSRFNWTLPTTRCHFPTTLF